MQPPAVRPLLREAGLWLNRVFPTWCGLGGERFPRSRQVCGIEMEQNELSPPPMKPHDLAGGNRGTDWQSHSPQLQEAYV